MVDNFQYIMKISRLTVDKLGIKMYDKVSSAIAELIANCYDADATRVTVTAPMGKYLAPSVNTKEENRDTEDYDALRIIIKDDGSGMTPEEINKYYLKVGGERRSDPQRPSNARDTSPKFQRKVMGRKGVGKLAPFGICQKIEVISAGGNLVSYKDADGNLKNGYMTGHIILDRNEIMSDEDCDYHPKAGEKDNSYSNQTGTTIILSKFEHRKVPSILLLEREIAQRFGIRSNNWNVTLIDSKSEQNVCVGQFAVDKITETMIEFTYSDDGDGNICKYVSCNGNNLEDLEPGFEYEGCFYPVTGWVAYSSKSFKDDLMAGIRIYCRGKIAAQTPLFNLNSGFTGEYAIRSYAIGELQAEWLDDKEDLILTDRRNILWSHEICQAFEKWGQSVIKIMGKQSREPLRQKSLELFKEKVQWDFLLWDKFPNKDLAEMRKKANDLVKLWAGHMRQDELENENYAKSVAELILTFAPYIELDEKLQETAECTEGSINFLSSILKTAKIAELSSFGKIAQNRIAVIKKLEDLLKKNSDAQEADLQNLIAEAPWLINPQWAPITQNKTFSTFVEAFKKFYKEHNDNQDININVESFDKKNKRADFIMVNYDGLIQVIEIKAYNHQFNNDDFKRLLNYCKNFDNFFNEPSHEDIRKDFKGYHVTLICEQGVKLGDVQLEAFNGLKARNVLSEKSWNAFLRNTKMCHQEFLEEAKELNREK